VALAQKSDRRTPLRGPLGEVPPVSPPWQIERRYGFGAGRVPLCPTPYRHPGGTPALTAGAREVWEDRGGLRGLLAASAPAALCLVALFAFVFQVSRGFEDESTIEIVAFEEPPELLAVEPTPPIPEPAVEPPKPPESIAAPEPAPVELAVAEPVPPPPPPVAPAPEPARRPEPAPVPVVAIEPFVPEPEPVAPEPRRRAERAPRVRPEELARVDVAPLPSALPEAAPTPSRATRSFRTATQTRARPKLQPALAAPALAAPPRTPEPERRRTRRDTTRPAPSTLPAAQLALAAPAIPQQAAPAPSATPRSSRATRARSTAPPTARQPALQVAALQAPAAAAPDPGAASPPSAARNLRAAPRPQRTSPPSLAASALAPAALAPAPQPAQAAPVVTRERRENRSPDSANARSEPDAKLAGVPLGSLASCVSDRLEDALKQKVMAAVTTGQECTNEAGRYRFLQTRNLNAFLMWIERAPTRDTGDRCDELQRALDCLVDRERRESQQG